MSSRHPKTYLITGAGSGMGRALALRLAQQGYSVILLGKTLRHLEHTDDLIEEARRAEPSVGLSYLYPLDLLGAQASDYEQLAKLVEQQFGVLHGLIHQAGLLGQFSPVAHYPLKMWHEILQVNLNAPFVLTRMLLPLLKKAAPSNAHVIFPMKEQDDEPQAFYGAYGVSKIALAGFASMLQLELESCPHLKIHTLRLKRPVRTPFRLQGYPGEGVSEQDWPEDAIQPYLDLLSPGKTGRQ